ncbi:MAG TPA: EutN/CcmL family microcompartment protein [Phycisphaeraceae bacterium]
MFLGRVRGHVVATAKDPAIKGRKLLVIEPLKVEYDQPAQAANEREVTSGARLEVTGRAIVALDMIGAGEGQLVLVVQGSSARMAQGCNQVPTDAVVIGIVDEAVVMGRRIV